MFTKIRKDIKGIPFMLVVIILLFLSIFVFFRVTKLFPNLTVNVCHLNGMVTQRIGSGVVCVDSAGLLYSRARLAEIMEKNDG